jgi:cytochrome P450
LFVMDKSSALSDLVSPLFTAQTFSDRTRVHSLLYKLRNDYPLSRVSIPGFHPYWIVTKHRDLQEIARNDDVFLSGQRSKTLLNKESEMAVCQQTGGRATLFQSLVDMDSPAHPRHRSVFASAFCPKGVLELSPVIERHAEEVSGIFLSSAPQVDFMNAVAAPYAFKLIMNILGVPEIAHNEILQLTRWLFGSSDPDLRKMDCGSNADPVWLWNDIKNRFAALYNNAIFDRRMNVLGNHEFLLESIAQAHPFISQDQMISHFMLLCTAGHESTAATAAFGMWELAKQSILLKQLQNRPEEIPSFVEETIRWATPVQHFVRSAASDFCISGQRIAKGDLVYLSYLSANFDEEEFADPLTFDHLRRPNRHLSFSVGRHTCLGLHLARASLIALWKSIIPKIKAITAEGTLQMSQSTFVSRPKSVLVKYELW